MYLAFCLHLDCKDFKHISLPGTLLLGYLVHRQLWQLCTFTCTELGYYTLLARHWSFLLWYVLCCDELGSHTFLAGHCNFLLWNFVFCSLLVISLDLIPCQLESVHTVESGFDTCTFICDLAFILMVSTTCNKAGTRGKTVQSGGNCIKPNASIVTQDNITLPLLLATQIVTSVNIWYLGVPHTVHKIQQLWLYQ